MTDSLRQTTQAKRQSLHRQYLGYYIFSLFPVLSVCYLTCHYERAESLLPLFWVEWTLVVAAFSLLCPWPGRKGVLGAALVFLLSFCVASIVTHESIAVHGAIWNWSDDWFYLTEAEKVVRSVRLSGWNLQEAWTVVAARESGAWTLSGWPFVLGLVSAIVTSAPTLELLHAIALSLNATFLALVLLLVCHVLQEPARRFPRMALFCFLLLIADPIVYAGMSLKESMLQFCLMLAFVSCWKVLGRGLVPWGIALGLGMLGIVTSRVAYVPLILFVLYWRVLQKIHIGKYLRVLLALVIIASFATLLLTFEIRYTSVAERLGGYDLEAQPGLAMSIYNIPVVGPVFFYAISPVPPLPWKILSVEKPAIALTRGAGSAAWFLAACYVLRGIARKRHLLRNELFLSAGVMFLGCFVAVVITGNDPRYKQPTNFYLAIMLFLTRYNRPKARRIADLNKGEPDCGSIGRP